MPTRRELLSAAGVAGLTSLAGAGLSPEAEPVQKTTGGKTFRIGIISARVHGKPQPINGHTWHFAQGFHPTFNMDAIRKYVDPGNIKNFEKFYRNPREGFGLYPFPDTRITHYYEADPKIAAMFAEAFPGVQVSTSVEAMVKEVDAVWLGDASGTGDDHFDLAAPGLERGLPTFCDKPIGGSVAGTAKILELARKHKAPIMSSSLYRHQWGTTEALRMRDSGDFGDLQYVICAQAGGYTPESWLIYGHHPTWMIMTLCGPGVDAVSMYVHKNVCHALVTYADRLPGEVWCGRPDVGDRYCCTSVHFARKTYTYSPAIEDNYWLGHHYQIFNMANTFRQMLHTGVEPVPHQEILEVTAILHAAARSANEKSRLVSLKDVMPG